MKKKDLAQVRDLFVGFLIGASLTTLLFAFVERTDQAVLAEYCATGEDFTIERMDLIPYGRCLCNEMNQCYCHPI